MAYEFSAGNGIDEDVEIVLDIGAGAANPRLKYDSAAGTIQISHNGSVFNEIGASEGMTTTTTWEAPARMGSVRIWPDETNDVILYKFGSSPANEQDGTEFGGFTDFAR